MAEQHPDSKEKIIRGELFELVQTEQDDGRIFEVAKRAPGVRLIIPNKTNNTLLLTKEFRSELNDWDFRLPGGKVFDSLIEYDAHKLSDGSIMDAATAKAKEEAVEEAGIEVENLDLFKKSTLGATMEWDLYVFEVTDWYPHQHGQQLEHGEKIEADNWFSYDQVRQMIMDGQMQEERIALVLLQWLGQNQS